MWPLEPARDPHDPLRQRSGGPMRSQPATLVWLLIAVMAAATVAALFATGLTVDFGSNPGALSGMALLFAVSAFYRTLRPNPRIATVTAAAGQLLLILLFGILLSYAASATSIPYRDAELYRVDLAMGFDRAAYLSFFKDPPWLAATMHWAYVLFLPQFTFMLAVGIALLMTSAIAAYVPAQNAWVYVDVTPARLARLPIEMQAHMPTLEALRAGTFGAIQLDNLWGLIAFPSFHTAGGLLLAWALWRVPYVRWPALVLNTALIASTPIDGAHYVIDVFGGAAVATAALLIARWLCRDTVAKPIPPRRPATAELSPRKI
jgi:membrane-associated phospholipid phosphatase